MLKIKDWAADCVEINICVILKTFGYCCSLFTVRDLIYTSEITKVVFICENDLAEQNMCHHKFVFDTPFFLGDKPKSN